MKSRSQVPADNIDLGRIRSLQKIIWKDFIQQHSFHNVFSYQIFLSFKAWDLSTADTGESCQWWLDLRWQSHHWETGCCFWLLLLCEMMWASWCIFVTLSICSSPPCLTGIFGRMVKYINLKKKKRWVLNLSCHQDVVGLCVMHNSWQCLNLDFRKKMNLFSLVSPFFLLKKFSFFRSSMASFQSLCWFNQ